VLEIVDQGDLDDAGLDQHLGGHQVEAAQRRFDLGELAHRGIDQQGVVVLVGDDADVVADGEIAAPALLAGAGIGGGEVGAATAAAAGVHGAEAGGDAAVAVGGAVLIGIAAAAAATEDIAEDLGEVGGGAVLHAVDMQGGFVGGVLALVEAVDPGADAV